MKTSMHIIALLLVNISVMAQEKVKVFTSTNKHNLGTELIIPAGDKLIYEKYAYKNQVYYLFQEDIVTYDSVSTTYNYRGEQKHYKLNDLYVEHDPCDSLINYIRNSAIHEGTYKRMMDSVSHYIGSYNDEFFTILSEEAPIVLEPSKHCHKEFLDQDEVWLAKHMEIVYTIKGKKEERLVSIKESQVLSKETIKAFLDNYDDCYIDHLSLIEIIAKEEDHFLELCETLSGEEFHDLMTKISYLPSNVHTSKAVFALKTASVKTQRRGMLIGKLKKNAM